MAPEGSVTAGGAIGEQRAAGAEALTSGVLTVGRAETAVSELSAQVPDDQVQAAVEMGRELDLGSTLSILLNASGEKMN